MGKVWTFSRRATWSSVRSRLRAARAVAALEARPRRRTASPGWCSTRPDASANTLSEDVLVELDDVLANARTRSAERRGAALGQAGGFIAGADIGEFSGMTDAAAVETRLTQGNAIVDRLDRLRGADGRRHPRLLPGRRARDRARLRLPDRGRGRAARFSRGDARPASRPRRHRAPAAPDQSARSHDA